MKKISILSLLLLISTISIACARTQYDSTGRHIIYDDSLRGQKRSAQQMQTRKIQAAAAAKINYENAFNSISETQPNINNNQNTQQNNNTTVNEN